MSAAVAAGSTVHLAGVGAALPESTLQSLVLDTRYGLAPGTVQDALGVRQRHVAAPQTAASDLAVPAAEQALAAAGTRGRDLDLVLVATSTPDHVTPATAPLVADRLGARCGASDVTNTCSGFLYAFHFATTHLRASAPGTKVLVVGANILSRRVDWQGDWSTAALFGDGAGAVVLEAQEGGGQPTGVLATSLQSDGSGYDKVLVPAGGSRTPLTPQRLADREHLLRIRKAPRFLQESVALLHGACEEALERAGTRASDVDWFVPHQANGTLLPAACDALGIPLDRLVSTLAETGNTSAASIPIALARAVGDGRVRRGDTLLLGVVAGGMTAGAAVVEWTRAAPAGGQADGQGAGGGSP